MNEEGFRKLLAENPDDSDLYLAYADWLEEQGRTDDALGMRLRRLAGDAVDIFTRGQSTDAPGYNGRVARKWFAKYPELRVVLVGYETVTKLGLTYMPRGGSSRYRRTTPAADAPTSAALYHRKSRGYSTNMVAFLVVPA
jgi:uncharacterized protein (TIGR02996 family)